MKHTKDLSGRKNPCYAHGHALRGKRSSTYQIWEGAKKRCKSPSCKGYPDYGGRGITFCDRWLDFSNFLEDMGERPDGMTLERIDNSKGYCLENCKWATRKEQGSNKRNNVLVTAFGKTQTIPQWSDETGLSYHTIYLRLRKGRTHEEAVTNVKGIHSYVAQSEGHL